MSDPLREALRALKPFVMHYEAWMDEYPDDRSCGTYAHVTFGQLRAARAALAAPTEAAPTITAPDDSPATRERASEMLTAYAELVKMTGQYAEMHYIPEIEHVITRLREKAAQTSGTLEALNLRTGIEYIIRAVRRTPENSEVFGLLEVLLIRPIDRTPTGAAPTLTARATARAAAQKEFDAQVAEAYRRRGESRE